MTTPKPTEVTTTSTTFELIEAIQALNGARLTELAQELELAKSTVHRHLRTLENRGYLVKDGDEYLVGIRFFDLGIHARNRLPGYSIASEKTREIAEETGELSVFMVEEHGRGYILSREEGPHAVATGTRVGKAIYLHATAGGKCILASLPRERVEAIVDRWGLPSHTDATITDEETLYEELERIRDRGYAFNHEEHIEGLRTVAAPVFDDKENVLGALCISGPTNRLRGDRLEVELRDYLLGAVNELELNIAYS
jgi:DNA-binding IclR family transcriptional regulator